MKKKSRSRCFDEYKKSFKAALKFPLRRLSQLITGCAYFFPGGYGNSVVFPFFHPSRSPRAAAHCNIKEEGLIEKRALTQALCRQMGYVEKGVAGEFNLFQSPPFFTGPLGRKVTEREGGGRQEDRFKWDLDNRESRLSRFSQLLAWEPLELWEIINAPTAAWFRGNEWGARTFW